MSNLKLESQPVQTPENRVIATKNKQKTNTKCPISHARYVQRARKQKTSTKVEVLSVRRTGFEPATF